MSCLSALESQVLTLLTSPKDILFLRHNVYREYGKIALGPDFIHTLPSLIIIIAITVVIWRHLTLDWLNISNGKIKKTFQMAFSWIIINAVLWHWLIIQRVLYCSVWNYWNNNMEFRDIAFPWWQKVWSSFYPPPNQPPVLSASLISWILSISLSGSGLLTALNVDIIKNIINKLTSKIFTTNIKEKNIEIDAGRERRMTPRQARDVTPATDKTDGASFYDDDYQSEISVDSLNSHDKKQQQREISPISYGTNWVRCTTKDQQKNISMKSLKTVTGASEIKNIEEEFLPRQTRNKRGCHTVIPSNSFNNS
ncbi:hypothetical protein HCN44_003103 [Aphidius gifuensis]|uniref:Uncharacterized protein n=1 Tax=Aphidius gifuensis TaxID=684658 RepID=A0A834XI50_APHGI|nr:uncharacterized protein LOC122859221 [Aphidius gifuensis]KAF7987341.1 hypothetical protein HCN44_003103 [Aphidius gifuensis]